MIYRVTYWYTISDWVSDYDDKYRKVAESGTVNNVIF